MKNKFSICSSLLVLALTILFSVSVQAQVFNPIDITGFVTDYSPADCGKSGSITIGAINGSGANPVKFTIAAGVDLTFSDAGGLAVDANGILVPTTVRSAVNQVVNSVRRFQAYLDNTGRIRLRLSASGPGSGTTARFLDITGIVNAFVPATAGSTGSITINNVKFTIAAGTTINVSVGQFVRIPEAPPTGLLPAQLIDRLLVFNANNELSRPLFPVVNTADPYVTTQICASPFFETGGALLPNSITFEQPVANIINGGTVCDQSPGRVLYGFVNTIVAPNFPIPAPGVIDQQVYGCLEFSFDQFGWVAGIKKLNPSALPSEIAADAATIAAGKKVEVVCGRVAQFNAASTLGTGLLRIGVLAAQPASNSPAAVQLNLGVNSFGFTIGAGQTLVNQSSLIRGNNVCIFPAVEPAGPSSPPQTPGTVGPVGLFQLFGKTPVVQTTVVATPSVP